MAIFAMLVTEAHLKVHFKKQFQLCYCVFRLWYLAEIDSEDSDLRQGRFELKLSPGLVESMTTGDRDRAHQTSLLSPFLWPFLSSWSSHLPMHFTAPRKIRLCKSLGS